MNKAEFLTTLEKHMTSIPQLEKERIMNYYNETIEDALEDGMSEEDVISSLGTMEEIISQIHLEHEITVSSSAAPARKSEYLRYLLLFLTSPFWLTAIALTITLYLLYIALTLINVCLVLALILFFITACFNLVGILIANTPSGLVLLGCMLVCLGCIPWAYRLLKLNIANLKVLYQKGINKGREYWRKVVA